MNNVNSTYANQLYGNNNSPAAVGSSPSAAMSDYSAYLSAQNNQLKNSQKNQSSTVSSRSPSGWTGNLVSPQKITTANTQGVGSASATQAASPMISSANTISSAVAKQSPSSAGSQFTGKLSSYDVELLNTPYQRMVANAQIDWQIARDAGDKNGEWEARVDANVARALGGGYISDVSNGTGYREIKISPADMALPEPQRTEVVRYHVLAIMDPENTTYYNSMANDIRSSTAGYTSSNGLDYTRTNNVARPPILDALYEDTSEFVNPYENEIGGLVDYLYNQSEWDASMYDPSSDPAYQAYEKYYTRNANSASQQALANASATTGGVVNSYAQQLAAAAAQSYMKQLTDVIPTLQQNARDAYEANINNKLSLLGSLNTMQGDAYDRFNTDRNFNMNQWLQNYQNEWNRYQLEQEIASREDEQAWQEQQNQLDRDFEKYLASLG